MTFPHIIDWLLAVPGMYYASFALGMLAVGVTAWLAGVRYGRETWYKDLPEGHSVQLLHGGSLAVQVADSNGITNEGEK